MASDATSAWVRSGTSHSPTHATPFAIRQKIAKGIDPVVERKQERMVIPTFREAADTVYQEHQAGWKNEKHQKQWFATLATYAFPALGDQTVDKIEGPAIRMCSPRSG